MAEEDMNPTEDVLYEFGMELADKLHKEYLRGRDGKEQDSPTMAGLWAGNFLIRLRDRLLGTNEE